jgi:hypothetical protein
MRDPRDTIRLCSIAIRPRARGFKTGWSGWTQNRDARDCRDHAGHRSERVARRCRGSRVVAGRSPDAKPVRLDDKVRFQSE